MKVASVFMILLSVFEIKGKIYDCLSRAECKTTKNRFRPLCYCDVKCFAYKDCCRGFYEANDQKNISVPTLQNHESCKLLTNEKYILSERIGAFMVDRCKDNGTFCETTHGDWNTMLPVSIGNTTYQNANCALCNNVTNFKHWKVAFVVDSENELKIKTRRLSDDEAIFKEVVNGSLSEGVFYLQPSVLANTRFCPYDALKNRKLNEDPFIYQNPIMCDLALYKNEEECLKHGCCKTMDAFCKELYLEQFQTDESEFRSVDTGMSMLLEFHHFQPKETMLEDVVTVDKVTITGLDLYLVIELTITEERSASFEDCVFSVISYFGKSTYKLFPLAFHYYIKTKEGSGSKVFFILMKSTTKLTLSEVADLLKLQHKARCEEKESGNVLAYGKVNTSTTYHPHDLDNSQDEFHRLELLFRHRNPPSGCIYPCANLSFLVNNGNSKAMIEMRCLDEMPSSLTSSMKCLHPSLIFIHACTTLAILTAILYG